MALRPPGPAPWRWLNPDEHPFSGRLLDLRHLAATASSTPADEATRERFVQLRERRQADPIEDPVEVQGMLAFPPPPNLEPGPLFLAAAFEEKWDLFFTEGELFCARSWTGATALVARVRVGPDALRVDRVRCAPDRDAALALAELDFLVWTHLFGRPVPHPVPEGMLEDAEATARWSYGQHGRLAAFATEVDVSATLRRPGAS